jgi:hypothetical protein
MKRTRFSHQHEIQCSGSVNISYTTLDPRNRKSSLRIRIQDVNLIRILHRQYGVHGQFSDIYSCL